MGKIQQPGLVLAAAALLLAGVVVFIQFRLDDAKRNRYAKMAHEVHQAGLLRVARRGWDQEMELQRAGMGQAQSLESYQRFYRVGEPIIWTVEFFDSRVVVQGRFADELPGNEFRVVFPRPGRSSPDKGMPRRPVDAPSASKPRRPRPG